VPRQSASCAAALVIRIDGQHLDLSHDLRPERRGHEADKTPLALGYPRVHCTVGERVTDRPRLMLPPFAVQPRECLSAQGLLQRRKDGRPCPQRQMDDVYLIECAIVSNLYGHAVMLPHPGQSTPASRRTGKTPGLSGGCSSRFMAVDIVLVPGLWLDGSSWDGVVPVLEQAGHRAHALTLPGLEANDADRSEVTLRDHVDAVVEVVDSLDPVQGKVALVGHSAGGALVHAAVDARPDRVARVVYVASEPRGDGDVGGDYPVENGEVPLPDWSLFEDEMLVDLDEERRAALRERAIPSPERVTRDRQRLSDERRYDVPATVIACEFPSAMLRQWMDEGHPGAQELAKLREVEYVDLPSGHWPQFTRPEELGRAILASVDRA
jgi:pimeloyl-ACP methyl ester carboxylesterase